MDIGFLITMAWKIGVLLLLVGINAFFVAAEFALVRIRDTQLAPLASQGNRRARLARKIVARLDTFISTTQVGITLAGLAVGAMVAPLFEGLLTPVFTTLGVESPHVRNTSALILGFFVNTFLLIVGGELVPKALAIRRTLSTALFVSMPLVWFNRLSYPFIWLLNTSSQWVMRQIGFEGGMEGEGIQSEEELRLMFSAMQQRAGGSRLGREIVLNALDLPHRNARNVMRPRQEITVLSTESSMAECLEVAEKTRYSRFPLCEAGNMDKMLGFIHVKDLYAMRLKARSGADLAPAVRKLIYVPETARLEKILQLLLERKLHLAIVVDEYGGTVGMISLENILEELVGQIQDEFDQEKPLVQKTSETAWELDGALPLHALMDITGTPIAEDDVATVSGLVTLRLGGFPKEGDVLDVGAWELKVEAMDGLRVSKLRLTRLPDQIDEET